MVTLYKINWVNCCMLTVVPGTASRSLFGHYTATMMIGGGTCEHPGTCSLGREKDDLELGSAADYDLTSCA